MTPGQIQQLIDQLLKTGEILATKAFELAMRQIYLKAGLDVFFGLLFLVAGWGFFLLWKKYNAIYQLQPRENMKYGEERAFELQQGQADVLRWTFGIGSPLLVFMFLVELGYVISYIVNPQWYAVQLLIDTFLGG